ncbi:MAG TPA: NUDIX hydrolase [Nitrososphaera sp.]|jgi:mutator protein MutT|nr:NUDIX hydrolase [Nitrososphaera sp.]
MKEYRNPSPTVDVILQSGSKILMIRRKKDPFKNLLALPGGFINEGETAEAAVKREAREETSLEVDPIEILGVYSDPKRDPRKHIMSVVFIGIVTGGTEKAGDDAQGIEWQELDKLNASELGFDHMQIIRDYKSWKTSGGTYWSSKRRNEYHAI